MAFRILADGTIVTDSVEEAIALQRRMLAGGEAGALDVHRGPRTRSTTAPIAGAPTKRRRAPVDTPEARERTALHARQAKISMREDKGKFSFLYFYDGRARWGGSFDAEADAIAHRGRIADAIAAGQPIPKFERPPGRRGRKPGSGAGGVYEIGGGKWRCKCHVGGSQIHGPSRATKSEAEADLALAKDSTISIAERRARLLGKRALATLAAKLVDPGIQPETPAEAGAGDAPPNPPAPTASLAPAAASHSNEPENQEHPPPARGPRPKPGTPEFRAAVSAGMRAAWARRRAARAATQAGIDDLAPGREGSRKSGRC